MAQISAHGRTKVGTLKKQFKEAYGVEIRIYNGVKFADEAASLASIRTEKKEGEISINAKMLVGNLEKKFKDTLGVKVQIEDKTGELADNSVTLASLCK
jgi:predicted transglutaminase-like protease